MRVIPVILTLISSLLLLNKIRASTVSGEIAFSNGIKRASKKFPVNILRNCERIFRLETSHFKSRQYHGTYSPGMEAFKDKYPYGWTSLHNNLWRKNPWMAPLSKKKYTENKTGKIKYFLRFPSVYSSIYTLCYFLQTHNNNAGRWFSLNPTSQQKYNIAISKIKPKITDSLLSKGVIL